MKCDVSSCPEAAVVVIRFATGGRYPYCALHAYPHLRRDDVHAYSAHATDEEWEESHP